MERTVHEKIVSQPRKEYHTLRVIKPNTQCEFRRAVFAHVWGVVVTNTHSLQSYPNINIRFISEAYLSGTKTVVIKFMGYVGITEPKAPAAEAF